MSEVVRITDNSVENAIQKGLRQLKVSENQVKITIISEGKKGLFGFGRKDAVIQIEVLNKKEEMVTTVVEDIKEEVHLSLGEQIEENIESVIEEITTMENPYAEAIKHTVKYLEEISRVYGAPSTVVVGQQKDKLLFRFETQKPGLLIGKYGKILNALQTLAQVMVHQYVHGRISVTVDVGDYRIRRSETLKQIADKTAARVLKTKQPVFLEPLPAYERKQIHAHLSKNKRISTHSEGKEPHRYLVVELAK